MILNEVFLTGGTWMHPERCTKCTCGGDSCASWGYTVVLSAHSSRVQRGGALERPACSISQNSWAGRLVLSLALSRTSHRVTCPQQMKPLCVLGLQGQSSVLTSYQHQEGLGCIFTKKNLSAWPHYAPISPRLSSNLEQAGMGKCATGKDSSDICRQASL